MQVKPVSASTPFSASFDILVGLHFRPQGAAFKVLVWLAIAQQDLLPSLRVDAFLADIRTGFPQAGVSEAIVSKEGGA